MFFKVLFATILAVSTADLEVNVTTCPETNGRFSAYLRHETDCNLYYQCNWGTKMLMYCPTGLYFNTKLDVCDYPVNVECKAEVPDVEEPEEPEEPEIVESTCPESNGIFAAFLPHETDCNQYYECDWGKKILMYCAPGLYFNPKLNVCDYPANVECKAKEPEVEEPEEPEEPEIVESTCPETNGIFAAFLPHETDCNQYYECDWGNKILMYCATGLYFNPKLNVCDYPANVECKAKEPEVEEPDVEEPEVVETICPETNGLSSVYLAHETNCGQYYQCDWGRKILMYCVPGLYFNTKLNVCDYPVASGCVEK